MVAAHCVETALIDNMNTIEEIKKAGWTEVERQQRELARLRERWGDVSAAKQNYYAEQTGYIKGMVFILNMMK